MCKVLIVENNPTVIKLLSHFFHSEGCELRLANDGLQAMIMLESFTPNILFTDIIMPKISGDELCRIVRNTPRLQDIFIVIYSAIAYEDEQQIFDLKADLYIAKGPNYTVKNHIKHVLYQFRSGKRREDIIHGKKDLYPRSITTELLLSRRHYHVMMDNLAEAVIEMDSAGLIIQANKAAKELLDCNFAKLLTSRLTDHLSGMESNQVEHWFTQVANGTAPQFISSYANPLLVKKHQVLLKLVRVVEEDGFFIIGILQDITPQKIVEIMLVNKVDEFNAVMESIEYGVLFMDSDLRARLANRAYRDMWGITDDFLLRQPKFRELINFNRYNDIYNISEEKFDAYLEKREADIRNGVAIREELHRKDGLVYQYQCVVLPNGGRMLTYFNITNHKNTQAQLKKNLEEVHELANRDPLTDLPNLRMLQDRFFSILSISKRLEWKIAIMFIDLDGFKGVNDTYGHLIGDMLLKMVAQRLLNIVRESDIVGRIGGDEFLIIQTEVYEEGAAAYVASKIIHQMSEPFELAENKIRIGASIGIAIYPTHGESLQVLIQKADNAMYEAKRLGKKTYTIFSLNDCLDI